MKKMKEQFYIKSAGSCLRATLFSLILCGCLLLNREAQGQKNLTLDFRQQPLRNVLQEIKQQSGYKIFYNEEKVNANKNITVSISGLPLQEALQQLLAPLKLDFEIINNTIVISVANDIAAAHGKPQNVKITGTVTDEKDQPLPGATVMLIGAQSVGTVTDEKGNFTIRVTSLQDELLFSFIGYNPIQVKINGNTDLKIQLKPAVLEMETVIATGYYPKAKNSFTGTAVVVDGADLRNINNNNFFDALKVFDPSFKVIDERGMYGSDPNRVPDRIEIRGQNSFPEISESNLKTVTSLPIFILDGFEITVEKVYDLDMNRIANVTILKDASAAAIYGSRAANGVIVIESKNPEAGKLQISYTFNGSLQIPDLSSYNLMNAAEVLEFQRQAGVFDASTPGEDAGSKLNSYHVIQKEIMSGVNTYWLSKPLQVSFQHRHSLFIEGSIKQTQGKESSLRYQIHLGGGGTKGVMKGSERNQISAGTKLLYQRKKLNITNDLQFSRVTSQESPYGSFSNYTQALPYHREKDENGKYYRTLSLRNVAPADMSLGISDSQLSPVYEAKYLSSFTGKESLDFYNNLGINWELISGLRLKGNFKISSETGRTDAYLSPMSYSYIKDNDNTVNDPDVLFSRGQYTLSNTSGLTLSGNMVVSYTLNRNKHLFQGIVGGELKQQDTRSDSYLVTGFMNDALAHLSYATQFKQYGRPTGTENTVRSAGAFSNLNYSFDNRYLIDLTGRLDGSSLFGRNQQTIPFWSAGIRWNISREKFMENQHIVKNLAIRASIGTIGNQNFTLNQAMSLYTWLEPTYGPFSGASVSTLGNPDLECQETLNRNIGLEFSLLKGSINFDLNYYNNITKGNLTDISIAPSIGFETYKTNMGDLTNSGIDFSLTVTALKTKDWMLSLNLNGTHNTNKIKRISEALKKYNDMVGEKAEKENVNVFLFEEGQSMNTIYAVRSLGIDPGTGKEIFLTQSGERTFEWNPEDQVAVGCKEATLEGYFGFNLKYRCWDLGSSFHYSTGADMYNYTLHEKIEGVDNMKNNDRRALTERWKTPGDIARYKSIKDTSPTRSTSRFVQKEHMLSLTSLRLSYTLPTERLKQKFISMLRLSATMNDLFYVSTIKQERGLSYPFARTLNFSAQINF